MNLNDIQYVFFIGIGGIGMSALARWFHKNGKIVQGYDKTPTNLTQELAAEGIGVHYQDEVDCIDRLFLSNPDKTLIVYTPAIPKSHTQLNFFLRNGFVLKKRAEVLGLITNPLKTIAVAGTHGKTTTSSMLAHLLKAMEYDLTAFLGGIAANFNSNLILNEKLDAQTIAVVEADEFDRSFLQLHPKWAILTSTDADHLDIYGKSEQVVEGFAAFVGQVQNTVWANAEIESTFFEKFKEEEKNTKKPLLVRYGKGKNITSDALTYEAQNIMVEKDTFVFDFVDKKNHFTIPRLYLHMAGFHNVENMTAALAAFLTVRQDLDPEKKMPHLQEVEKIRAAVGTYKGVKRRFEFLTKREDFILVDDYAHHPTEITAFLRSLRALYPTQEIVAIFQPHLYTRTRDFLEGFAKSLELADETILIPLYPARELPLAGISSKSIYDLMQSKNKKLLSKAEAFDYIQEKIRQKNREKETKPTQTLPLVVATIGAGDISNLAEKGALHW
ncbi:UDP-N-acetylmuramate--L-alanine ligase [Hugenholtzia roseola]|uniref:UDP-N-acetylmuramate--L-alanine ligase n=1 Tax=Hugenholtzia roseola TaxID=1002 RepID=UPI000416D33C|nr:UDP-N-acetylmuramate--L-alanine ligase [Hugenholtzia roseola]